MFSLASLPPSPRHKHTHTEWEDQGKQEEQHSSSTSLLTHFPKSQHKKTGVSFTLWSNSQTPSAGAKTPREPLRALGHHGSLCPPDLLRS